MIGLDTVIGINPFHFFRDPDADNKRHEGATVLGHRVDGGQRFAHGGDEGNLVRLVTLNESPKMFPTRPVTTCPSFLAMMTAAYWSLITLLGSAYPLRRASRYDPAPILRGE